MMDGPRPPARARSYYKCVAISGDQFVSIFDGRTRYELNGVTSPPGGCFVSPDLISVVRHSQVLPSRSARLGAPRVILQVLGWSSGGNRPATPRNHGSEPDKELVEHVMPVAVLPYTAAGQPGTAPGQEDFLSDSVATLSSRPSSAPPPRPPELRMSAGSAARSYGGQAREQAVRLQAATVGLHEDVLRMQGSDACLTPWTRPTPSSSLYLRPSGRFLCTQLDLCVCATSPP